MIFIKTAFLVSLHCIPFVVGAARFDNTRFRIRNLKASTPANPDHGPFYMEMPLDHFSDNNEVYFYNRYWVNADNYKSNGPIILVNEGETGVMDSSGELYRSSAAQLTQRLNGILILMEHRFYGESKPNMTTFSDSDETFYKLSSEQALADMAYLLKKIEFSKDLNVPPIPETKVISYGCSYSGNLAAWMRLKYPDTIYAAIAGSAPVQAQVDFHQYFDPIIRYGPAQCVNALEEIVQYVDHILFGNSTEEVNQLKKLFGVEELYDDDFASFLSYPLGNWQYASDTIHNRFVSDFCDPIFSPTGALQVSLGQGNNLTTLEKNVYAYATYLRTAYQDGCSAFGSLSQCFDSHNVTNIKIQRESSHDSVSWVWQFCNEFGYFQIAAPDGKPTIVSRKYDTRAQERICMEYFKNLEMPAYPDVDKTNSNYGGWDIDLDRVIWIDGEYDNWRELSVHSPLHERTFGENPNVKSIIISKASHCVNYEGLNAKSTDYLQSIQDQQYEALSQWLGQS